MTDLESKIDEIRNKIDALNLKREITLLCATKTVPTETINTLPKFGINLIGENRVQELMQKYPLVKGLEWHFIGALQTNKVKQIIDKVTLIHSVDRISLADEIDRQAAKTGVKMSVLAEVNIGGEENKSGVSVEGLTELTEYITSKDNLILKGLMTVMPISAEEKLYKQMNVLYQHLKSKYDGIEYLSMGMSDDYVTALKHGSNLIRLGRAIFGARQ